MRLSYSYNIGYRQRKLAWKRRLRFKIRKRQSAEFWKWYRQVAVPRYTKRYGRKPREDNFGDVLKAIYPPDIVCISVYNHFPTLKI